MDMWWRKSHHLLVSVAYLACGNAQVKVKVSGTLVQALRLCTGRTAHRGSRGIAVLFLDNGTRRGWGLSVTPRPLFIPRKDLVPIVQEAGWAPGPVWTGAENLAPIGIRSPDRPPHNQPLYRLRYPVRFKHIATLTFYKKLFRLMVMYFFQGLSSARRMDCLVAWPLEIGPICCLGTRLAT